MPSPGLSELITTTLRYREKSIADNVLKNNALLAKLQMSDRIRTFDGGRTIVEPVFYAENSTFSRYSGYDTINVAASDVISAAEFSIKQAAVAVTMSGLEMLQNSGREQALDWFEARLENAETTLYNNIAGDVYSSGTADGGKQIGGLQLLVADNPTSGSVGGIDRSVYTFWQNRSFDATTDGGAAASASNIQNYMDRVMNITTRGRDKPDLIVADGNYFTFFQQSLQAIQRITSDKGVGRLGFPSFMYVDAEVVLDGGFQGAQTGTTWTSTAGGCPANHMYFLNTKYLKFRPHKDMQFKVMGDAERFAVNQDAMVRLIGFAGNLTLSNAQLQAVLKD